jgi:hypothetical protein
LSQHLPKAAKLLNREYRAKFPDATAEEVADLVKNEIEFRLREFETSVDRMQAEAS